jgi:cytochrome c oxidase subunit II
MTGRKRIWLAGAVILVLLFLSACARHTIPQDTLNPAGEIAHKQAGLFWLVFWIATVVFVLVEGLLVVALIRFRHRPGRGVPKQIHGNKRLEIAWTIAPALLLAGVAVPTIGTIFQLAAKPANALQITVTGHQWWWQVEYPSLKVITANEVHIPAGRPVYVTLKSVDVIHSFWVPRLAGKQDLEPGNTTHLTFEADRPGNYSGQCAEFCGDSHANMRFRVIAQTEADFEAWAAGQQRPAPVPGDALRIMQAKGCGGCHTIGGEEAFVGTMGPDLTHFGSRTTFAGAIFPNTEPYLRRWLEDPPAVKPGADMPNLHLTRPEIDTLIHYLENAR